MKNILFICVILLLPFLSISQKNTGSRFIIGERITLTHVYFWQGIFSPYFPHTFSHEGLMFMCAEQAFQYEKARFFRDTSAMRLILEETDPRDMKKWLKADAIKGYGKEMWKQDHEYIVMRNIYAIIFTQNEILKQVLVLTTPRQMVYATPFYGTWSCGLFYDDLGIELRRNWKGENLLGLVLEEVRLIILGY